MNSRYDSFSIRIDFLINTSLIDLLSTSMRMPLAVSAPRISLRGKVNQPLLTGVSTIDSFLPIGRGQRQLILGDRGTGKTYLFKLIVEALVLNKHRFIPIYVGINQVLSRLPNLLNTICLITTTSMPVATTYLAPFCGITMAEYYRDLGYDVVLCFDDLTKHAKCYRQMSLCLNKIPSREAYPSDIFYAHSGLLERAGKLSQKLGGGSITCFPIAETQNDNLAELIATNLISITDGQIYMSKELWRKGVKPAIDTGLSVSRIGSAGQCELLKQMSRGITPINWDQSIPQTLTETLLLLHGVRRGITFNKDLAFFLLGTRFYYAIYLVHMVSSNYSTLGQLIIEELFDMILQNSVLKGGSLEPINK